MTLRAAAEIAIAAAIGIAAGIGGYTFLYARGASYLTNDPSACANCHVMRAHFDAWVKSSHRAVAVCNDCHTPPGLLARTMTKASNGFWHSFAFTTGRFPDPLSIRPRNRDIAERACRSCHGDIVQAILGPGAGPGAAAEAAPRAFSRPAARPGELSCVRCHGAVGHPEFSPSAPGPRRS